MKRILIRSISLIVSLTIFVGLIPAYVSAASQVSQLMVSVQSNHINKIAAYSIVFYTGDTVDSALYEDNNDKIYLKFPTGTVLPVTISNSNIVINNQVLNQGSVTVDTVDNTITLPLPNDMVIPRNSFVRIEIAQNAGIKNPSVSSGNYTLQVWTTKDTIVQTSTEYSILDTMITVPSVTVSPNIIGEAGAYMINFRTSSEGDLVANSDSIYIFFPLDTAVPTNIDKSKITINNVPLAINPVITNDPLVTGDPNSRYRMELRVPVNIQTNSEVNIVINSTANILHPTTKGNYYLEAWTTQDKVKNKSTAYEIAEAVSQITVWLSPDIAGQAGQYSVAIKNGASQFDVGNTITIQFPTGTVLSSTSISNHVYIDGIKLSEIASATVAVNQSALTVTINPQKSIAPNGVISVLFTQNAGILNPQKQGSSYVLKVKTTKDIAYRTSSTYTIQGNHITNLTTQLTNDGIGLNGEYLIQFTVSNVGGLVGGQDIVTINFPSDTVLPASLTYSAITVNDKALTQNVVISQANRSLKLTIPNSLMIAKNGNVTISIPQSAVIKNPSIPGNYKLEVFTSRDPVAAENTIPYIVGKQITTPTIAVSPNTYNTPAQYAIGFYTSDQGAISSAQNDFIEIVFPNGTGVPSAVAASSVKVNGLNAASVQVSPLKLKINLPSGTSIANNGYVGIVINSSAGILNPVGGTYQLKVSTSKDKSLVPSQSYTTVGTSPSGSTPTTPGSTNNTVSLQLNSQLSGVIPEYVITYKTGTAGALTGGMDEITILFDSRIELPGYISKETIKVNGVQVNSGWIRRDGQSVIFRLPTTLNIGNSQTITITIDKKAEIPNPTSGGTYAINVMTTKDTMPAGATYTIQGSSGNQLTVTPEYNSIGAISKYTMLYTTGVSGSLKGGYDYATIILPISSTSELINNIKITVNGVTVPNNQIEVSGKNLSFLLPYNVSIPNSSQLMIVVEDPKYMTIPNTTGSIMFHLSTSKETSFTASNSINTTQVSTQNPVKEPDEDKATNPSLPTNINIKLTIGTKEAEVNGKKQPLLAAPVLENGTTLVPLRFITENLGGKVEYREAEKRIIIIYNGKYLILTVNSNVVYTIDQTLQLAVAPKVINGTTLVPLRFIAEWMNIDTTWNGTDKTITLKK